jgi:hypothetical protein
VSGPVEDDQCLKGGLVIARPSRVWGMTLKDGLSCEGLAILATAVEDLETGIHACRIIRREVLAYADLFHTRAPFRNMGAHFQRSFVAPSK